MKKISLLLLSAFLFSVFFQSCQKGDDDDDNIIPKDEVYVSKDAKKKIAILEEFTGVRCGYCPQGHDVIKTVLEAYPDQVFSISYHPSNTVLTEPYDGYPDLRRDITNDLFTNSFAGKSLYMPGAFIVRRKGLDKNRLQGRNVWKDACGGIITEDSPVNVGFKSSINNASQVLSVLVQLYFTQDVTDKYYLYVMLAENGIITKQAGANGDYTQNHVFREILNTSSIWGQEITEATTTGSMVSKTITFDNSAGLYNMSQCELVVFVRNGSNEEVVSGNGALVGMASPM